MNEFVPLVVAAAMVWTALSLVKHLRAGQYGDALTLAVMVVVGVVIAWLASESSYAGSFNLADAKFADLVFVGYGFSSTARTLYEFKKSFDNGDDAKEAKLFPNPAGTPDAPEA